MQFFGHPQRGWEIDGGYQNEVDHAVIKHDDADVDCCCYDLSNYLHVDSRRYA